MIKKSLLILLMLTINAYSVSCSSNEILVRNYGEFIVCKDKETGDITIRYNDYLENLTIVSPITKEVIKTMENVDTIPKFFVRLATLDDSLYKKKIKELKNDIDTSTFLSYFYTIGDVIKEKINSLSFILFLLLLVLTIGASGYSIFVSMLEKQDELSEKRFLQVKELIIYKMLPSLAFFTFALLPFPNGVSYEPLFLQTVRTALLLGVKVADDLTVTLNKKYLEIKAKRIKLKEKRELKNLENEINNLKELYKKYYKEFEKCKKIYGVNSFYNYYNEISLSKDETYSPAYCLNAELTLERIQNLLSNMIKTRNEIAKYDLDVDFEEIKRNYKDYLYDASLKGDLARYYFYTQKLGFLSFLSTIFLDVSLDTNKFLDKNLVQLNKNESIKDATLKFIAKTIVFAKMPPGSYVLDAIDKLGGDEEIKKLTTKKEEKTFVDKLIGYGKNALNKVKEGIASLINLLSKVPFVGSYIATAISLGIISLKYVLASYISFKFMLILPVLALALAFIYNFIMYLINVFKLTLLSYTLAIYLPSKRRFEIALENYLNNVFYYALYPFIMILSGITGIFILFIGYNLINILVDVSTQIATFMISNTTISFFKHFIDYFIWGASYYIFLLLFAFISFMAGLRLPERISELLSLRVSNREGEVRNIINIHQASSLFKKFLK